MKPEMGKEVEVKKKKTRETDSGRTPRICWKHRPM